MSKALELSQVCEPDATDQCLGPVQGECCPVPVNDPESEATKAFITARDKMSAACGGIICAAVLCGTATQATCESQSTGSGRCVLKIGLPL
jgi:hypothetical protein